MPQKLITIANFTLPVEANLAKAKLESDGIQSFVIDEHTVGMDFAYSQALGGVKLQVRKKDARRATEILAQGYRAQLHASEKYDDKFHRGIARRQRFVLAVVIVVLLITLAMMILI